MPPLRKRGRTSKSSSSRRCRFLFPSVLVALLCVFCVHQLGRFKDLTASPQAAIDRKPSTLLHWDDTHFSNLIKTNNTAASGGAVDLTNHCRKFNCSSLPIIIFVHVGKAGGLSIRQHAIVSCYTTRQETIATARVSPRVQKCIANRYRDKTEENTPSNTATSMSQRPILPLLIQNYVHLWHVPAKDVELSTAFLFNLRHPVERFRSAFLYSHPTSCANGANFPPHACSALQRLVQLQNKEQSLPHNLSNASYDSSSILQHANMRDYYVDCFPSIGDLANAVLLPTNATKPCRILAKRVVQGPPRPIAPHLSYHYGYYVQQTLQKHSHNTIYAIRTDHLEDDFNQLDSFLGGSGQVVQDTANGAHATHGSERYHQYHTSTALSALQYKNLCCALYAVGEFPMYETIIRRAANWKGKPPENLSLPTTSFDLRHETLLNDYERCHAVSLSGKIVNEQHLQKTDASIELWKAKCAEQWEAERVELGMAQ